MPQPDIEEIEHTADWAIRVRGRDLPELFANAARGMFGLLTDLSGIAFERRHAIALRAIDAETLLVDWLNELLFLSEQEGIVFGEFDVDGLSVGEEASLRARVGGGRPAELYKVIKAATFNGLSIRPVEGGFQAEVVFDV
jgi:SHS2 domain-containing protein